MARAVADEPTGESQTRECASESRHDETCYSTADELTWRICPEIIEHLHPKDLMGNGMYQKR
jgi:hypothetical protein